MSWFILSSLSGYIVYSDVARRHIDNKIVIFVCLLTVSISSGVSDPVYMMLAFLVGFVLFVAGFFAGGDIKLMLAYLLGIDPQWWSVVFLMIAGIGGIMAIGYLAYGYLTRTLDAVRQRGLPYGVPIAFGGCFGVWLSSLP